MKKHVKTINSLISALILLTGLVLLAGCAAPSPTPTPTSTLTLTPVPTDTPTPTQLPDPQNLIANAWCGIGEEAYRANTTIQMGNKVIQQVMEFAPPDRNHFNGDDGEAIIIGDMYYAHSKDKMQWIEFKIDKPQPECQNGKLIGTISQAQYVGQDNIEGNPYQVIDYQYQKTQNGVELNQKIKLWIDRADGFLYKLTIEGDTLSISSDNVYSSTQGSSTLILERNPVVKIEKPEPVVTLEPTPTPTP